MVPTLMQRLYGSDDLFPDDRQNAYHAYQSVNYVTSHDGFTLHDLVSYDRKHNEANGQEGQDGADENFSWNCGWERAPGAPADVLKLRVRQAKNCCALLFLANGTPMLRAGDEFLHRPRGAITTPKIRTTRRAGSTGTCSSAMPRCSGSSGR